MSVNIIIPEYIKNQSEEVLNEYVKLAIQIRDYEVELVKIDDKIQEAFINVHKQVGKYMPEVETDRVMMGRYEVPNTTYDTRKMMANVNIHESFILGEIYATEEYLKTIRGLILDRKQYWKQKEALERKLNKIGW
jgi:hypothetical protein